MQDNLKNIFDDGGCLDPETLLSYADKKLTASEQHRVERHLSGCEFCTAALQGLAEMTDHQTFEDDVAELNQNILLKKNNPEKGFIGKRSYLRIAATVALFIVASGGLYYFLLSRNDNHILTETTMPSSISDTISQPKNSESKNSETSTKEIRPAENSIQKTNNGVAVNNEPAPAVDEPIKSKTAMKDLSSDEGVYKSDRESFQDKTAASRDCTVAALDENTVTGGNDMAYNTPAAVSTAKNKSFLDSTSEERKKEDVVDLQKANESLESTNTKDDFNHGLDLFNSKQYAKAIPIWEKLSLNSVAAQKDDVYWYLANCYIQTKQSEKAKPLLENLFLNSARYKHPADSVLHQLYK